MKSPRNQYYYYDQTQCTFVEVKSSREKQLARLGSFLGVSLIFAVLMVLGLGDSIRTPQEFALQSENEALINQLKSADERFEDFDFQLSELGKMDQDLYRTILQVEPIDEDIKQLGVGGADVYSEFEKYGGTTRELLVSNASKLDALDRQLQMQLGSSKDLLSIAEKRESRLLEMPAIIPIEGKLVSGFGMRFHPIDRVRKAHHGIDITADRGTQIVAAGNGVVSYAARRGNYGNTVEITHKNSGYVTRYAHLSKIDVKVGQKVTKGDPIAKCGSTGRSTAPHLHYEVRTIGSNKPLNPIDFFAPGMSPKEFQKLKKRSESTKTSLD